MPASAMSSQDPSQISPPPALPDQTSINESSSEFKLDHSNTACYDLKKSTSVDAKISETKETFEQQKKIDEMIASFGLITREQQNREKIENQPIDQLTQPLPLKPLQIVTNEENEILKSRQSTIEDQQQRLNQQVVLPHLSHYHSQMSLSQSNVGLNGQPYISAIPLPNYYQQEIQELTSAHLLQQQQQLHQMNSYLSTPNGHLFGHQNNVGIDHFTDFNNFGSPVDLSQQHIPHILPTPSVTPLSTPTNYIKNSIPTMYWPSPISTPTGSSYLIQPPRATSAPVTPAKSNKSMSLLGGHIPAVSKHTKTLNLPISGTQNGCPTTGSISNDLSTKILVKFLPITMKGIEFQQLFSAFGRIKSCKLINDKTTGKSLGYGFVTYESTESAESAIERMNECVLTDRPIKVMKALRPDANEHTGKIVLYVSGLGYSNSPMVGEPTVNNTKVDKEELAFWFGQCGQIIDLKMVHEPVKRQKTHVDEDGVDGNLIQNDKKTSTVVESKAPGLYKIVAFITYSTCSAARRAIETLHGKMFVQQPNDLSQNGIKHTERLSVKFSRDASKNGELEISTQLKNQQLLEFARDVSSIPVISRSTGINSPFSSSMSPSSLGIISPTTNGILSPTTIHSPQQPGIVSSSSTTINAMQRSQFHEYLQNSLKFNSCLVGFNQKMDQKLKKIKNINNNNTVDKTVLFVQNLPFTASEIDLLLLFSSFGSIISSRVVRDISGLSKGFGLVSFRYEKDAENAVISLNGILFGGNHLKIEYKQSGTLQQRQLNR